MKYEFENKYENLITIARCSLCPSMSRSLERKKKEVSFNIIIIVAILTIIMIKITIIIIKICQGCESLNILIIMIITTTLPAGKYGAKIIRHNNHHRDNHHNHHQVSSILQV